MSTLGLLVRSNKEAKSFSLKIVDMIERKACSARRINIEPTRLGKLPARQSKDHGKQAIERE